MFMAMTNWMTPSVLFCALNLIIAALFVISKFKNLQTKKEAEGEEEKTGEDVRFFRAPSLLERVKSIKLTFQSGPSPPEADRVELSYKDEDKTREDVKFFRAPSLLERVKSIKLALQPDPSPPEAADRVQTIKDEEKTDEHVRKIKSLPSQEAPVEKQGKVMTKSESEKKFGVNEDVAVERRRPETVRERRTASEWEDEAVDEKADDFIHKFKQHLKLQRIDSILRNRGVAR